MNGIKRNLHEIAKRVAKEWNEVSPESAHALFQKETAPLKLAMWQAIVLADLVTAYRTNGAACPIPAIVD